MTIVLSDLEKQKFYEYAVQEAKNNLEYMSLVTEDSEEQRRFFRGKAIAYNIVSEDLKSEIGADKLKGG